ncbi:hypothetical protein [Sphingobacterium sp. BIGb0165]|uniref:hypothetical protein n=1 Tax=Sphingobacterium sp. BIGb0165 TaxID=2940615 RepID=UPI002168C119|nr:hypothetical protein [Sphingobacterium sp. BIGb0165]MCS4227934.1 hypothetical protein [Sphingobacterium sp. BIGb0165]
MNKVKEPHIYVQFIIPAYFIFLISKFAIGDSIPGANALFTSLFVMMGYSALFLLLRRFTKGAIIPAFVSLLVFCVLFIVPFSENYRLVDFFLVFNYFGIALIPIFYTLNFKIYRLLAYLTICYFFFFIIKGTVPDEVFSISRNFISVVLLISVGFHIISATQNNRKPSPLILVLALFVAVWGVGRSGIFSFSVLLVLIPLLSNYKFLYKFLLISLILILSIYAYTYFADSIFYTALYRIENMGAEDVRETMNQEYLKTTFTSLSNIIFGTPLLDIESLAQVEYNPHNSFIRLHIFYGLFGFIIIICSIIYALIKYVKIGNYVFMVLLMVLLFRSSVDSTAFHGPLDPLIFYLLFMPLKNIKLVKR